MRYAKPWMPLLHLDIRVPFITVRTCLMRDCFEASEVEYARFEVQVWKWKAEFTLWGRYTRELAKKFK